VQPEPKEAGVTFGAQLKQKVDEVHLQEKAKEFGDAVAEVVTAAAGLLAGYVKENRSRFDDALDTAERFVNERTDGKHAEAVLKVRSSVDKGVDSLVTQEARASASGADAVPDDVHSAFDDEAPDSEAPDGESSSGPGPGTPPASS
jgi:hypothetical protein